jgi:hypothetical protein
MIIFTEPRSAMLFSFVTHRLSEKPALPALLGLFLLVVLPAAPAAAQQQHPPADTAPAVETPTLGALDFPNSGAAAAQEAFQTGVLALHSFWYPEARDRFQRAQRLDPGFALAYWGEALTHDHPLWEQHDRAAGRAVLARLDSASAAGAVTKTTPREQAYLDAVRALYEGEGALGERRDAYAEAMNRLAEQHPEDEEAAILAALARMSQPRFELEDADEVVRVAAPLEELYRERPEHPGVLHYLIHAYDSKTFAPMGLRMARTYARVAPSSSHALHMPSHIFREMGKWDKMAASNVDAYEASIQWQQATDRPLRMRDFHSYRWLFDAYMAQERYGKTAELVERLDGLIEEARTRGEDPGRMARLAERLRRHQEERTMTE